MSHKKDLAAALGRIVAQIEMAQTETLIRAGDVAKLNTPVDTGNTKEMWETRVNGGGLSDRVGLGDVGMVVNNEPHIHIIDQGLYPNPGQLHWYKGELVQRTNEAGFSLMATAGITPLVQAEMAPFFRARLNNV